MGWRNGPSSLVVVSDDAFRFWPLTLCTVSFSSWYHALHRISTVQHWDISTHSYPSISTRSTCNTRPVPPFLPFGFPTRIPCTLLWRVHLLNFDTSIGRTFKPSASSNTRIVSLSLPLHCSVVLEKTVDTHRHQPFLLSPRFSRGYLVQDCGEMRCAR